MPDAVRIYAEDHPRIIARANNLIAKRVDELTEQLATFLSNEASDYRQRIGHIQGMREALGVLQNLEKELNG